MNEHLRRESTGDELLPLVSTDGTLIGSVPRSRAHGDPSLIHPVVHCLVVNRAGEILLQLRSATKDIQPGKWDTSVGGHIAYGEPLEEALLRELEEEIGITVPLPALRELYRYVNRSPVETELVHTFLLLHEGPFSRQESEIDELRYWTPEQIKRSLSTASPAPEHLLFTPNFEHEWSLYRRWCRCH